MAEEKAYSRRISRDTLEKTRRGIHNYIIVGKRYRNPKYTALQLSGNAVRYWMNEKKIPVERVLVVCLTKKMMAM